MFSTRPELVGTLGMVSSTHWLASQAGMAVLEEGGNAFDAAVATGFVLQVVEPHLNGPGGDATLILRPAGQPPVVLCGQGAAPAAASIEHYRAEGLEVVPGTGLLAAAVPGATPAWLRLLRDHGTCEPERVLRFAIGYAEHGAPVLDRVVDTVEAMAGFFTDHWPTSAETWLPAPERGGLLRRPELAATYRRLLDEAVGSTREARCEAMLRAWQQGFVAEAIGAYAGTEVRDSSGAAHAGVITAEDLADGQTDYEPPASVSWRGQQIFKAGLWSQGPVFLQTLALLDPLLPAAFEAEDGEPVLASETLHTVLETLKLTMADRDAWYGDAEPEQTPSRLAGLLDPAYLDQRRGLIGARASTELRPGALGGHEPRLAAQIRSSEDRLPESPDGKHPEQPAGGGEPTVLRRSSDAPATDTPATDTPATDTPTTDSPTTEPSGPARGDTCHLDIADRWGNVITATPSGGWLQASPTVPGLGFCLGTRLQMTWLEPGLPSSLVPGRRPRTTLSPSLAIAEDGRTTAFGTPGGDQQDQWPLIFWLTHVLGGLDLQQAIDHPSLNTTAMVSSFEPRIWVPGGVEIESRYGPDVLADLRARGHRVTESPGWSLGRICAVSHDPSSGLIRAAANPRGMQGYAVGR